MDDPSTTPDLTVDLAPANPRELRLTNPVIAASGCFGYGLEYAAMIDIQRLGAFVSPGITPRPRRGHPMPRTAETPAGLLSATGLPNPGIHALVRKYPPIWAKWDVPAIVNISADHAEDYAMMAAILDEQPGVAAIEVNSSAWDAEMTADVTRAVRAATTLPLIVKLGPGECAIADVAQAAEEAGADAVSLINTVIGMAIDVKRRRPALANLTGGLSGPAIKPIALWMVYQVRAAVTIPVIGMGGIAGVEDALEFLMAGANAVQVGTAILVQPNAPIRLIDDLAEWMTRYGVRRLDEIVGVAHAPAPRRSEVDLATAGTAR